METFRNAVDRHKHTDQRGALQYTGEQKEEKESD